MPATIEADLEGATQTQEAATESPEELREQQEKPLRERINRMQEDVRSYLLRAGYFHERIQELSQSISSPADKAKFLELQEGLMERLFDTVQTLKKDLQQLGVDPEQLTEIKRSEESLKRYGYSEKAAFKSRLNLATQGEKKRQARSLAFRERLGTKAEESPASQARQETIIPATPEPSAPDGNQATFESLQKHLVDNWEERLDQDIFTLMNKQSASSIDRSPASDDLIQRARLLSQEISTAPDEEAVNKILTQRNGLLEQFAATIWYELTNKAVLEVLQRFFPEVEKNNLASFINYSLHEDMHDIILKMHEIGSSIDYSKSEAVAKALEQRQKLLEDLVKRIRQPDQGMRPESEKIEETYAPVNLEDVRADISKRAAERLKQKADEYFNKFDQLYGEFQPVAMRATPEARKNLDEIFVDFIAYENANPETIPVPLKQALLDAALEAYKTANKHEFSHTKFYSLSPDEREKTGANTLNQIAGHLHLRPYLIEKTSLPPAQPAPQPKPKMEVPSAEAQPAPAPTEEVKPAEAPINPELLKVLDTLREATGISDLSQPEIKRLYELLPTDGDPKQWHQGIKDEIVSTAQELVRAGGLDYADKEDWNAKVALLPDTDPHGDNMFSSKGIDIYTISDLFHNENIEKKLSRKEVAASKAMQLLKQRLGLPAEPRPKRLSPADIEAMIAYLPPKARPTPTEMAVPFAQKLADIITQKEATPTAAEPVKTEPNKAKIKATAENPFKVYRELVKNIAEQIAGGRDADETIERAINDYIRNPIRATSKADLKKRLLAETRIVDAIAVKSPTR